MTKYKVYGTVPRPTRGALISLIVVGVLFLPLSAFPLLVAEGEARPFAAIFSVIWFVACLSIIGRAVKMLKLIRSGQVELGELEQIGEGPDKGFAERLRDLEALNKDGLITPEEYQSKRAEILAEKW